jgi:hypothetical protein
MWLTKSLYESLPFYYIAVGVACLAGALYLNYGYWPIVGSLLGSASLVAGLVVWLKRRDYRRNRSRVADGDTTEL